MPRVFLVKQKTDEQPVRRCKNCGKDISNKRKGAEFCCKICYMSYIGKGIFKSRYYN